MRRLNFQTPGMISHPPIPISELSNHIERLKANDNLKFSQEYESIEPGQQFTWDHSNMEVNKKTSFLLFFILKFFTRAFNKMYWFCVGEHIKEPLR